MEVSQGFSVTSVSSAGKSAKKLMGKVRRSDSHIGSYTKQMKKHRTNLKAELSITSASMPEPLTDPIGFSTNTIISSDLEDRLTEVFEKHINNLDERTTERLDRIESLQRDMVKRFHRVEEGLMRLEGRSIEPDDRSETRRTRWGSKDACMTYSCITETRCGSQEDRLIDI